MSQQKQPEEVENETEESEMKSRREFLIGLGKWSKVIIGGAVFGGLLTVDKEAQAWVNRRGGGGWVNRRGYGGGGGRWINGRGYGGGGWANARGGGGWANRRGGGSWANRR